MRTRTSLRTPTRVWVYVYGQIWNNMAGSRQDATNFQVTLSHQESHRWDSGRFVFATPPNRKL